MIPDADLLARLEWEALHADFTGPKHRLTTAQWRAWDGYEPNDYNGERFKRDAPRRFAQLPPATQARLGIRWWEQPEWR